MRPKMKERPRKRLKIRPLNSWLNPQPETAAQVFPREISWQSIISVKNAHIANGKQFRCKDPRISPPDIRLAITVIPLIPVVISRRCFRENSVRNWALKWRRRQPKPKHSHCPTPTRQTQKNICTLRACSNGNQSIAQCQSACGVKK